MISDKTFNQSGIIHSWLELIRPPNLFTIPGDILAGASLALVPKNKGTLIFPAIAISLLLYVSGLVLNDYSDRATDKMERPGRPIPSGRVSAQAALGLALGMVFMATGIGIIFKPFLGPVTLIIALIVIYNFLARQVQVAGFLILGLCRGMNLFLGAVISNNPFSPMVLAGAGAETFYITAVSALASRETNGSESFIIHWLPLFSLITMVLVFKIAGFSLLGLFFILLASGNILSALWPTKGSDQEIPKKVGQLIRSLNLIQCTFIAVSMNKYLANRSYHLLAIMFLLLCFLLSRQTAKRFYGS